MEPLFVSLFLFTLSSIIASFLFICYRHKPGSANSPPGRLGWPLIGETIPFFLDPGKFVRERMEKYQSNVFQTSLITHPMIMFCGPAENKFLFSNENKLVVAWWPDAAKRMFPHSLLFVTGDRGHQIRRQLMKFMKQDDLNQYVGIMDAIAQRNMQSNWEGKGKVRAFQLVKDYNFRLSCRIMIGTEDPDKMMKIGSEFKVLFKGLLGLPLNFPGTAFNRAIRAVDAIRRELKCIIEERRAASLEKMQEMDLLSGLLLTADDEENSMAEEEAFENVMLYLFAAHESSTTTIAMVMKYLAEMPRIYDEVLREQRAVAMSKERPDQLLELEDIKKMKYSWNVVSEALRLRPPIQGSPKVAITDFNYAGYHIPKGSILLWNPLATHMNPEWFPEPEKFDPTRFDGKGPAPYTFTAFGGGPRMCPGKEFARIQILVFLHNVIKRFRWEMICPTEKIVIKPTPVPSEGLPLRLQPHQF